MGLLRRLEPGVVVDLYISDGNIRDWLWGSEGIFAYGFELSPGPSTGNQGGFYPPDETIAAYTERNRDAVLQLMEVADCPYRASGTQTTYCGGAPSDPGDPGDGGGPGGGGNPGGVATPPAPTTPPPPAPARVAPRPDATVATLLVTRARFDDGGHLRLRVRCAATVTTLCRGTIKIRARLPGSKKLVTIAATNYVVAAGARSVALRLGPTARRALRRRTAITVTAIVATRQDDSGASTAQSTRVKLVRQR